MNWEIRDLDTAARTLAVAMEDYHRPAAITYAPGNGTQFKLIFTPLNDGVCEQIGCSNGRVLVALVNFGTAFHFAMTKTSWTYIAEKLSLKHESDAQAIADLIAAVGEYRPHALAAARKENDDA